MQTLPPAPERDGYTFAGWNTAANGTGETFTETTAVMSDTTVYAKWTPVAVVKYTVRFNVLPIDSEILVYDLNGVKYTVVEDTVKLPAGDYTYSVSKDGYISQKAGFTVSKDMKIDIVLQTSSRSALLQLLQKAETLLNDQSYPQESRDELGNAIEIAQAVADDPDADNQAYAQAVLDLQDAIDALVSGIEVSKIKINASALFTLSIKKKAQIPVLIEPENASDQTVKWISTNPNIFTVDENGNITPKKQGTATLTAQSSNGLKSTIIVRITA